MLKLDVVTIFPDYIAPMRVALLGKAMDAGLIHVETHDLRDWTYDVHKSVDDAPFGGGPGMVMRPDVWGRALDDVCPEDAILVVPTPAGVPFTQQIAEQLSREKHIVFACGRYEGIDERVWEDAARRVRVLEVSIGDYVLVGGEVAVLVIVEAVARLLPGVLGNAASHQDDSFQNGLLEGPSYTRPRLWRDLEVPSVLLSGDHARVEQWRLERSLERTRCRRPDLMAAYEAELPKDN